MVPPRMSHKMAAQGSAASKAHGVVGKQTRSQQRSHPAVWACPGRPLMGLALSLYNAWLHLHIPRVCFPDFRDQEESM